MSVASPAAPRGRFASRHDCTSAACTPTFELGKSLLDGPRSGAALELLTVVAALRDDGGGGAAEEEEAAREAEAEGGRVATFGSPLQTWDGVDANGGRAADLMYGVMMSAAMDPAAAALPACLVRDSVE